MELAKPSVVSVVVVAAVVAVVAPDQLPCAIVCSLSEHTNYFRLFWV